MLDPLRLRSLIKTGRALSRPTSAATAMTDIIYMTKQREPKVAAVATAPLHEVMCIAAHAMATGALCVEGRAHLVAGVLPALAPGWQVRYLSEP